VGQKVRIRIHGNRNGHVGRDTAFDFEEGKIPFGFIDETIVVGVHHDFFHVKDPVVWGVFQLYGTQGRGQDGTVSRRQKNIGMDQRTATIATVPKAKVGIFAHFHDGFPSDNARACDGQMTTNVWLLGQWRIVFITILLRRRFVMMMMTKEKVFIFIVAVIVLFLLLLLVILIIFTKAIFNGRDITASTFHQEHNEEQD